MNEPQEIFNRISSNAKETMAAILACFDPHWPASMADVNKAVVLDEAADGSITWIIELKNCFDPGNVTQETTSVQYLLNKTDEVSRFTSIKAGEYFLLNIWWAWNKPSGKEWLEKMLECTERLIETKVDVKVLDDDAGLDELEFYSLQALRARLEEKLRENVA